MSKKSKKLLYSIIGASICIIFALKNGNTIVSAEKAMPEEITEYSSSITPTPEVPPPTIKLIRNSNFKPCDNNPLLSTSPNPTLPKPIAESSTLSKFNKRNIETLTYIANDPTIPPPSAVELIKLSKPTLCNSKSLSNIHSNQTPQTPNLISSPKLTPRNKNILPNIYSSPKSPNPTHLPTIESTNSSNPTLNNKNTISSISSTPISPSPATELTPPSKSNLNNKTTSQKKQNTTTLQPLKIKSLPTPKNTSHSTTQRAHTVPKRITSSYSVDKPINFSNINSSTNNKKSVQKEETTKKSSTTSIKPIVTPIKKPPVSYKFKKSNSSTQHNLTHSNIKTQKQPETRTPIKKIIEILKTESTYRNPFEMIELIGILKERYKIVLDASFHNNLMANSAKFYYETKMNEILLQYFKNIIEPNLKQKEVNGFDITYQNPIPLLSINKHVRYISQYIICDLSTLMRCKQSFLIDVLKPSYIEKTIAEFSTLIHDGKLGEIPSIELPD